MNIYFSPLFIIFIFTGCLSSIPTVEERKESLIDEIEAKLKQKIDEEELFLIKWRLI